MTELSIVIPCYNESGNVLEFHRRVAEVCESAVDSFEFLFVDDGSSDDTLDKLKQLADRDDRVRILSFSRNFGHQAALTAGLDHADGRAVIVMDADLQHPPDLIPKFLEKWREGYEVVYAYRKGRRVRLTYKIFNWLMQTEIPAEAADFRLTDRRVVLAFRQMNERSRFLRGILAWLGFKQIGIPYEDQQRFAGDRTYTYRKTFGMALGAILAFSRIPLRIVSVLGTLTLLLGLAYAAFILYSKFFGTGTVEGWTATLITILVLGGVQLLSLGVIAEYISQIYEEVKHRPIYVLSETVGLKNPPNQDSD